MTGGREFSQVYTMPSRTYVLEENGLLDCVRLMQFFWSLISTTTLTFFQNLPRRAEHLRREVSRLEGACQQMKLQLNALNGTGTAPCSPALSTSKIPNELSLEAGDRDELCANSINAEVTAGKQRGDRRNIDTDPADNAERVRGSMQIR